MYGGDVIVKKIFKALFALLFVCTLAFSFVCDLRVNADENSNGESEACQYAVYLVSDENPSGLLVCVTDGNLVTDYLTEEVYSLDYITPEGLIQIYGNNLEAFGTNAFVRVINFNTNEVLAEGVAEGAGTYDIGGGLVLGNDGDDGEPGGDGMSQG